MYGILYGITQECYKILRDKWIVANNNDHMLITLTKLINIISNCKTNNYAITKIAAFNCDSSWEVFI